MYIYINICTYVRNFNIKTHSVKEGMHGNIDAKVYRKTENSMEL